MIRYSKSLLAARPGAQRGVVLIVSLIMLLVITLIAVTSANISQTNLRLIQNLESREMARFAAKSAIEEAISSNRFTTAPNGIFAVGCGGGNQRCYDVNGDGADDITVAVAPPACVSVEPIRNSDLDVFNNPNEATCFLPPGEFSLCAASVWEFQATATDLVTGAEVTVRQGLSILTTTNVIDTSCPT